MKLTVLNKNNPGNRRGKQGWAKGEGGEESGERGGEEQGGGDKGKAGQKNILPGRYEAKDRELDTKLLTQYFSQEYRLIIPKLLYECNRTEQISE